MLPRCPATKKTSHIILWLTVALAGLVLAATSARASAQISLLGAASRSKAKHSKANSNLTEASRLDAPTPDGSPTLHQTSDWLAETLAEYGKQDWDTFPSTIQDLAISDDCNLGWEDVTNPGKNASYEEYSVPLGIVTRITIDPQSMGGNRWIDLTLHTDKGPAIANSSWVGKHKLFSKGDLMGQVWFVISSQPSAGASFESLTSQQVTYLIQKGLQHAVDLCRKSWQPTQVAALAPAQTDYSKVSQWFQNQASAELANHPTHSAQQSPEEVPSNAAENRQEIQDKIDNLNQEIQQLESDAEDADQNANNLLTSSNCNSSAGGIFGAIGEMGCKSINETGAAKFRSQAAKDRNQIDDDRAEIAQLQGQKVQETPHRDASFAGALAQRTQQNPQPSIVDTANQEASQMVAVGAANDAVRRQAAEQRREQAAVQQVQANAQQIAQEVANGTLTPQQAMQQIQQQAQQAAQQQSASGGSQTQTGSPCAGFPALITASSTAFSRVQFGGNTAYSGSLTFNIPQGYHSDGAEIDNMSQGSSFAAGSGTVITIGDTASGQANSSASFTLANATNQMTYRASFPTNVPAPFSITLKRDDQQGCGQGSATGSAGVPQ